VKSQARDGLARLHMLLPDLEVDGDPVTAPSGAPPPP
jgi:hypothetical protein